MNKMIYQLISLHLSRCPPRTIKPFPIHMTRRSSTTNDSSTELKIQVKDLYKNLIYLSRDWHYNLKPQIKEAFMKNKSITDPNEIKELIAKGEYVSREIIATYRLKKYRTLKRRYESEESEKHLEDLCKNIK